jgi:hypothetical protein
MFYNYRDIETGLAKAELSPNLGASVRGLLTDYWQLGQYIGRISDAEGELATLDPGELFDLMRLLFAHPIWSVAEAAATVLSALIDQNPARERILFDYSLIGIGASSSAPSRSPLPDDTRILLLSSCP